MSKIWENVSKMKQNVAGARFSVCLLSPATWFPLRIALREAETRVPTFRLTEIMQLTFKEAMTASLSRSLRVEHVRDTLKGLHTVSPKCSPWIRGRILTNRYLGRCTS